MVIIRTDNKPNIIMIGSDLDFKGGISEVENEYLRAGLEQKVNLIFIPSYPNCVLFHSDRGSQYCSYAFRDIIDEYNFIQSMSRKGNCWDNAVAESFFKTLKMEETDDGVSKR